jgi:opacity protein-like surface antigen
MRKLLLALVTTTAVVSSANADTRTGFYAGANLSANVLQGKGKWSIDAVNGALNGFGAFTSSKSDLGKFGAGVGAFLGYGWFYSNCFYMAGELAYDFNSAKPKHSFNQNLTDSAGNSVFANDVSSHFKFKKENIFNFAALFGWKITPSTVGYLRLGGNVASIKVDATAFGTSLHRSKTRVSFVPGIGLKTFFMRNWAVNLEWTHDFGNGASKTKTIDGVLPGSTITGRASLKRVQNDAVKLGIAYIF